MDRESSGKSGMVVGGTGVTITGRKEGKLARAMEESAPYGDVCGVRLGRASWATGPIWNLDGGVTAWSN